MKIMKNIFCIIVVVLSVQICSCGQNVEEKNEEQVSFDEEKGDAISAQESTDNDSHNTVENESPMEQAGEADIENAESDDLSTSVDKQEEDNADDTEAFQEENAQDITVDSCYVPGDYLGDKTATCMVSSVEDFDKFLCYDQSLYGSTAFTLDLWGDFFENNILLIVYVPHNDTNKCVKVDKITANEDVLVELVNDPYYSVSINHYYGDYYFEAISKDYLNVLGEEFSVSENGEMIDTADFYEQAADYNGINEYSEDYTDY